MKAILNSNIYSLRGSCSQLQAIVANSSQSCFIDNGFCNDILLNDTNLNCLATEFFDLSDFQNEQAIQQV